MYKGQRAFNSFGSLTKLPFAGHFKARETATTHAVGIVFGSNIFLTSKRSKTAEALIIRPICKFTLRRLWRNGKRERGREY
jgi:hypothetical protein